MYDFMMSDLFVANVCAIVWQFPAGMRGGRANRRVPGCRNHTSYISTSDISD